MDVSLLQNDYDVIRRTIVVFPNDKQTRQEKIALEEELERAVCAGQIKLTTGWNNEFKPRDGVFKLHSVWLDSQTVQRRLPKMKIVKLYNKSIATECIFAYRYLAFVNQKVYNAHRAEDFKSLKEMYQIGRQLYISIDENVSGPFEYDHLVIVFRQPQS